MAEASELRTHLLEALYARSRSIVRAAETLQRSLLTDPPELDRLEVAVRYVPAAREAQVGGDWYDVFAQPDGSTILVIGDVVGPRHRGGRGAWPSCAACCAASPSTAGDGPAGVLGRLDTAIAGLRLGAMATVLVGRLEDDGGRRAGMRLRWASAGHLPPLVIDAGRPPAAAHRARPGLLLGVDPGATRTDQEVVLEPGSTVLLYTDGLVERRDQVFDDGIDAARRGPDRAARPARRADVRRTARPPAARTVEDDVALVAVRLAGPAAPRGAAGLVEIGCGEAGVEPVVRRAAPPGSGPSSSAARTGAMVSSRRAPGAASASRSRAASRRSSSGARSPGPR